MPYKRIYKIIIKCSKIERVKEKPVGLKLFFAFVFYEFSKVRNAINVTKNKNMKDILKF